MKSTLYSRRLDKFFRTIPTRSATSSARRYRSDRHRGPLRCMGSAGVWRALLGIPIVPGGALFPSPLTPSRRAAATGLSSTALAWIPALHGGVRKGGQKFAERANIFHEYLPYAIVYGCVDRWANAFKDLGIEVGQPGYKSAPAIHRVELREQHEQLLQQHRSTWRRRRADRAAAALAAGFRWRRRGGGGGSW